MSIARIGVLLDPKDRGLIEEACATRGEDISSFVRRAIKKELASLGYYPVEINQVLGIKREAE